MKLRHLRSGSIRFSFWAPILFGALFFVAISIFSTVAHGALLGYASDAIETSAPSTSANHTITFKTATAIPASGQIAITSPEGAFTIPAALDYTDIDLSTSTSLVGTSTERSLAAAASASDDGVSVTSGAAGSFTITLNSTQGIGANVFVRLKIGTHAVEGASGDERIENPSSTGSYRIRLETRNAALTPLDYGTAMIAIVPRVAMQADTLDFDPPVLSNGLPSGTIPAGIRFVEITFNTDEMAKCRYATTSGVSYDAMTNFFSTSTFRIFHAKVIETPTDNTLYTFNIRCTDYIPNKNTVDYPISFTVEAPLPPPSTGGGGGGSGGGGGGGGGAPYPPALPLPQVSLVGRTMSGGTVTILKDGVVVQDVTADSSGDFNAGVSNLAQGAYTFSLIARDGAGRKTGVYSTAITVITATHNTISGILLTPTIGAAKTTVGFGDAIEASGYAAPRSNIDVWTSRQTKTTVTSADIVKKTTTADARGAWSVAIPTNQFSIDTYEVRARNTLPVFGTSAWSPILFVGVGKNPAADACGQSDLNRDGKVNLVDFSILLFHWGTTNPIADINDDGKVNLVDFSVMLFCWTG